MALATGKSLLRGMVRWAYQKTNTGFTATKQGDTLVADLIPNATIYQHVFASTYTIAAAGTQAVDFYGPWTALSSEVVTATKIVGFWFKVTGNSTLKVAPHGTNPLTWPFTGTVPAYEIKPSTGTGHWQHFDGSHAVVSATVKQWLMTNTGASSLTVTLVAFCGT